MNEYEYFQCHAFFWYTDVDDRACGRNRGSLLVFLLINVSLFLFYVFVDNVEHPQ
jgi:hypothetical protein